MAPLPERDRFDEDQGTVGGKTVWNSGIKTSGTPRKKDGALRQFRSDPTTFTITRTSKRKRPTDESDEDAEGGGNDNASSNEDENAFNTHGEEDVYQPKKISQISLHQRSIKRSKPPPARRNNRSASRKTDESGTGKSVSSRSTPSRAAKKRGSIGQPPFTGVLVDPANENVGDSEDEPDPMSNAHHFWEMALQKKARERRQAEEGLDEDYELQLSARPAMRQREVKTANKKHATTLTTDETVGVDDEESPQYALGRFHSSRAVSTGPPDKQHLSATTTKHPGDADGANSKPQSSLMGASQDLDNNRISGQAKLNILSKLHSGQTRRSTRNSSPTTDGSSSLVKDEGDSNKILQVAQDKKSSEQHIAQALQKTPSTAENVSQAGKSPAQEKVDREKYKTIMLQRRTESPLPQPAKSKGKKKGRKGKAAQRLKEDKNGESPAPDSACTVCPVSKAQADMDEFLMTRYHCTCCDTTFTGLSPAENHMFSSTAAMLAEQIVIPPGYYYG